jgi:hypothetical protein
MKFATIALAMAFALSSTFALAQTNGRYYGSSNNRTGLVGGADPGTYGGGAGGGSVQSNHDLYMKNLRDSGLARGSNSRGNLVGGADSGVRKP